MRLGAVEQGQGYLLSGRRLILVWIAYPSSVPSAPLGRHARSVGAMLCAGARPSVERQKGLARAIEVPIVIVCAIGSWFVYSVFSRHERLLRR